MDYKFKIFIWACPLRGIGLCAGRALLRQFAFICSVPPQDAACIPHAAELGSRQKKDGPLFSRPVPI